jgi:hypothetical protein
MTAGMTATTKSTAPPRGWLATLIVLVVMLGIVVGGCVASNALANEPPKPINVSHGVSLTAPWDWEYSGKSEDGNTILLSRGNGSLAVSVDDDPNPRDALEKVRTEFTADGKVTASEIRTVSGARPDGQDVLRFAYSGTFPDIAVPVEGEVTAVTGDGYVVLFDGWAGLGDYVTVRDEIATMISGATIP